MAMSDAEDFRRAAAAFRVQLRRLRRGLWAVLGLSIGTLLGFAITAMILRLWVWR